MPMIHPYVMCGGSGTRLWPLSRRTKPKQFLPLVTDLTMFQETVRRVTGDGFAAPVIIAGEDHRDLVATQLAAIGVEAAAIILEPMGRNTAAAAAIAACDLSSRNPEGLALLLPADHHVEDPQRFRSRIIEGSEAASEGRIVTFGVLPVSPHTGYGYIERGDERIGPAHAIAAFREKPDAATAAAYLAAGSYYWNAGIFLFSASAMQSELRRYAPDILDSVSEALAAGRNDGGAYVLNAAIFGACRAISVDYAVMEKTDRAAVLGPLDVGWSDIGGWAAVADSRASGGDLIDCREVFVSTDGPRVAAIGVEGLVIVATRDAVLVCARERTEDVKQIVEALKAEGATALL